MPADARSATARLPRQGATGKTVGYLERQCNFQALGAAITPSYRVHMNTKLLEDDFCPGGALRVEIRFVSGAPSLRSRSLQIQNTGVQHLRIKAE